MIARPALFTLPAEVVRVTLRALESSPNYWLHRANYALKAFMYGLFVYIRLYDYFEQSNKTYGGWLGCRIGNERLAGCLGFLVRHVAVFSEAMTLYF